MVLTETLVTVNLVVLFLSNHYMDASLQNLDFAVFQVILNNKLWIGITKHKINKSSDFMESAFSLFIPFDL